MDKFIVLSEKVLKTIIWKGLEQRVIYCLNEKVLRIILAEG